MKVYLFTDKDSLLSQTPNQEFGAITSAGGNSEKFRLTSIHNCQANSKAYAITDGLIKIQPNENDPTLVNVILKPLKQCIDNVFVAYFVYRGVKKSSIFGTNFINTSGSDLCNLVNETITKLNQKYPQVIHNPEQYILGYGSTADLDFAANVLPLGTGINDILVDSIFNTSNLKFKPFPIKAGAHIGNFNTVFGVDVILAKDVKVSEVRKADNFIISQSLTGLTGEDFIQNKAEKEQALDYFDICQFYSLTYENIGVWAKNAVDTSFSKIKSNSQIVDVLNLFNNRNYLFLDIRNEYNNSLNYQDNIAGTIGIKKDSNSYSYVNFPTWPLLKIDIQSTTNLYIRIPKSDFLNVRAYFREDNKSSYSFKAINFDSSNYSTELKINMTKAPSGATLPSYCYFMLLKELDGDGFPTEWVIKASHFVDTLFDVEKLIYTDSNENVLIKGASYLSKSTKWKIYDENRFLDLGAKSVMAKIGVAEDTNNLYFFAFSNGNSLQTGSLDVPIITGDSDKSHFPEDILFPKVSGIGGSIYSYLTNVGGVNKYVINTTIGESIRSNSNKLVPTKDGLTMIAIDKQESLTKLKNAYLQFANNLPKRLAIRNQTEVVETSGKKHYEAKIVLIGYGLETSTNSYQAKIVETDITLIYSKPSQKILGTTKFNQLYFKTDIQINGENFYGVMYQNIRYSFRTLPDYVSGTQVVFQGGRRDIYFKVLGKCISPSVTTGDPKPATDTTWYFVELMDDEQDFENPQKKGLKGNRYFISSLAAAVIIAKFGAFIDELQYQDSLFDAASNGSQNDTLEQRITRYRQRGHNSNVDLFNDVIGTTVTSPVYKNQIPYEVGQLIPIPSEAGTDPSSVGFTINTRLQLYADIEVAEFSNGKRAEIQHMFVGLDVLGRLRENFTVWYGVIPIDVINNIHFSLHSGDAGSVPNVVHDAIINDPETDGLTTIRNTIVSAFNQDTATNKLTNPLNNRFYKHFLNTRFAAHDMNANIYSFGLYYQMFKTAWKYYPSNPSVSLILEDLFLGFNEDMSTAEANSVAFFYQLFNSDSSQPISASTNSTLFDALRLNTFEFSKIWRKVEEKTPDILDGTEEEDLRTYSYKAIQVYIDLINSLRNQYLQ